VKKRGLIWFKNDLRLHDNESLVKAHEECDDLICCYCVEKSTFDKLELGFRKADLVRFKFLEQSVIDLRNNLESIGGHLFIGELSAINTLPELIKLYGITDIYAEEEYASEELNFVKKLKDLLPNIKFHFFLG